ncbi:hypothetical protein [Nesterenkonia populi]
MSKYGTAAYDPNAAYGTGPLTEPAGVRRLKSLVLVLLGLSVVSYGLITAWTLSDAYVDGMMEMYDDFGLPAEDAEEAAQGAGGVIGAAISAAIMAGLYLLVYFGLRAKGNWARILGIVLAILGILATLVMGLFGLMMIPYFDMDVLLLAGTLLYVLHLALTVYWLILAFKKETAHYLRTA